MTTVTVTNSGLDLQRDSQNGVVSTPIVSYVAVGSGIGILSTALVNGNPYTSLAFAAGLTAPVVNGASLTLTSVDGAHTQVVTASASASIGATSVAVTSFNANFAYPIGAGLVSTPTATQTSLDTEILRDAITSAVAGSSHGEALWTLYIPPPTSNVQVFEAAIFAGPAASGTPGSGVMIGRMLWAQLLTPLLSGEIIVDSTI